MPQDPEWWNDPVKVAQAKRIAAGPAGELLSKHPLFYSKAVFFGERPTRDRVTHVNNATVTLLRLQGGVFAVTCTHVLHEYQKVQMAEHEALFQIGDVVLDPISQLASKHDALDLATIRLTEEQIKGVTHGGEIGSRVVQPVNWPPQPVVEGNVLMFGGFPGVLRERRGYDELSFGTFSAAGIRVAAARDIEIICQLERDYWVKSFGEAGRDPQHLRNLGGLSGGPAFIDRGLHWEFAGIVYEFSPEFDIIRFRPARLIAADGTIQAS